MEYNRRMFLISPFGAWLQKNDFDTQTQRILPLVPEKKGIHTSHNTIQFVRNNMFVR